MARDLRLRLRGRGRASALRPGGARRPALVGPRPGLPHRGARPGQGAAGQERRHRAGRRQGRLLPQAPAGRRQPRRDLRGRHLGLQELRLQPAVDHRQYRRSTASFRRPASCGATRTIPISSSPPTRARRPSPTPPTPSREKHGFWLDDAFASGGSAGYDHKKMGITAKGAWEAVKRHFREINRDIQTTPFTVVGVGDMSGDVFGNGMLLSRADPADRRLRPSRHLHRSRSRYGGLDGRARAHVRAAALELAGLRQDEAVGRRRHRLAQPEVDHACRRRRQRRSAWPRRRPRRSRS